MAPISSQAVVLAAVPDRGVISASGLGAIEFAKEIFAELGIFGEGDLRLYEEMYRHGREPSVAPTGGSPAA